MREAQGTRKRGDLQFVLAEGVGVDQGDSDGVDAGVQEFLQGSGDLGEVRGLQDFEVFAGDALYGGGRGRGEDLDAFVYFDDCREELLAPLDVQFEDVGPRLVADQHEVLEALGGDQGEFLALALQEGVSRHSSAHSDPPDLGGRHRVGVGDESDLLEQSTNSLGRGI